MKIFKKSNDERIQKESNVITAKMFYLFTFLLAALLVGKLIMKAAPQFMVLEIICLAVSTIFILASKAKKGILLVRDKDDAIKDMNNEILAKAFSIDFFVIIFGELILIFMYPEDLIYVSFYFLAWIIPALVVSVYTIKKGWLLWGGKKQEQKGKKTLAKSTAVGALFFGIIMGWPMLIKDGTFNPMGILWILGIGAMWGIPFYFIFAGLIKLGEKRADKLVEEAESHEE